MFASCKCLSCRQNLFRLRLTALLYGDEFLLHSLGNADLSGLGDQLPVFLEHHALEDLFPFAAAKDGVGFDICETSVSSFLQ